MGECELKAKKGLIRVKSSFANGKITKISISGDFMVFPEGVVWDLEKNLLQREVRRDEVERVVRETLRDAHLLGSSVEDFIDAILCSLEAG
ncbi:MAG: hypothetical protein G5Z42_06845 [Caldisphaeraceae archaeon]|nr:hypothetical protein [Caldisphaeraceae archaeon]MEB3691532.1 hypothetical protein [Caldisphaeraceae archaeon]MEB3798515.1 hypothetical protein [Caldisphaeraceae archaeon]